MRGVAFQDKNADLAVRVLSFSLLHGLAARLKPCPVTKRDGVVVSHPSTMRPWMDGAPRRCFILEFLRRNTSLS
jgi:hypothetical protein